MTKAISSLQDKFLAGLTHRSSTPLHVYLVSSMSTNKGGLGLPHPRCVAISTLILSMKHCINHSTQGVWVGNTTIPVQLSPPPSHPSLPTTNPPQTNNLKSSINMHQNLPPSRSTNQSVENKMTHFLHKSSPNTCKEQIKDKASSRITTFLLHNTKDFLTKKKLLEILQPRPSKSLIEMSRAEPSHRQKNQNFHINLKRKL